MDKNLALSKFVKNGNFRGVQEAAIDALIQNENVLCLMPTGGGKSLIYQVSGVCKEKTVLVISPLIALMNQHHDNIINAGFSSVNFSGMDPIKQFKVLTEMVNKKMPDFIFSSPERITNDGYLEFILALKRKDIGLVVVDEVHCISQWGEGFRPAYKNIPSFLNTVFGVDEWPSILCLTATLNDREQQQIIKDFKISRQISDSNLWRPNLKLEIINLGSGKEESKDEKLTELLELHNGKKILVFVHRKFGNKGTTKTLYEKYRGQYPESDFFDSDIPDKSKQDILNGFRNGSIKLVFATSAFGMGIDIEDISVVINYLIPETVEQYYQEVGRSGRNGNDAYGYLLYTNQSKNGRKALLRSSLCTENNLREEFEIRQLKNGDFVNSISYLDMNEEQRIAFALLVEYGIITIEAKGILSIKCLDGTNTAGKIFLENLKSESITGLTKVTSKETGQSINALSADIWKMCSEGNLKMILSPSKAVFFSTVSELDDSIIQKIISDQDEKKELRLQKFSDFVQGIESGLSAEQIIRKALNLNSRRIITCLVE